MGGYVHGHGDPVLQVHRQRTVANSAAYLAPRLRPGLDVLDVGCGPGTITVDLARRVAPGRVVGIDLFDAPLVEARALADREGVPVTFTVGDVYALEAADHSFDVVHAHQVLQYLTDPVAALREMARVCRPGGVLGIREGDYGGMVWHPPDEELDRWLQIFAGIVQRNGGEPEAGRRLVSWAHAAGLRDLARSASAWCFSTPAEREWWGRAWAGRVTTTSFAEQAVSYGLATRGQLHSIAAAWQRWVDADDGWFGMLQGELLVNV
ncbi:class I SAM-dependent methyltransferase [Geodermatophilus sp. URMC 64]